MNEKIFFHRESSPQTKEKNSPLSGVKIAIQPNLSVRGWPTEAGSPALEHYIALEDATVISRIRNAGALLVGSTHMSELGFGLVGDTSGTALDDGHCDAALVTDTLVEIVTEPDMRSPHDAMEFLRALRTQIWYVGAADCSMETGAMRANREGADYFETVVQEHISPRTIAQWIASRLLPAIKDRGQTISETSVTPKRFSALLAMAEREEINASAAREALELLFESDKTPEAIVEEHHFPQIGDAGQLEAMLDRIIPENPDAVENFKKGKTQAAGFLIGQAMRASKGKANPKLLREIPDKKLGSP